MAKRKENSTREEAGSTADSMEQRVLAFAEQIGRIYGTVQAKAEGWLDRDKLNAEIESIRDSATDLLAQIGGKKTAASKSGGEARAAKGSTATTRPVKSARPAEDTAPAPKRAAAGKKAAAGGKKPTKMGAASTSGATGSRKGAGRSGGAVDAPGKKHRGPMPSESAATGAPRGEGSRVAKLKAANLNRIQRRG
jgi:hypothetical protein